VQLKHIRQGNKKTLRFLLKWEGQVFDADGWSLRFGMVKPGQGNMYVVEKELAPLVGSVCDVVLESEDTIDLVLGFYLVDVVAVDGADARTVAIGEVNLLPQLPVDVGGPGGPSVPENALSFGGEVLTFDDEILTFG